MLIDRAEIYVAGGKGGDGCMSFRREKYVPKGGPDGGDGGDGGHVLAEATEGIETLLDFTGRHHWVAENGRPGEGRNRTGRRGKDLILRLPSGTLIYDRDTGVLLKDLCEFGEPVCVAEGGHGGRGNARFARATHQTPREFEPGTPGQERWLRLELKLIADVGVVGLPNAGKSTLLSRLSRAKPKIADYPFTTLSPVLGIVDLPGDRRFVMADIPGLIEGAHEGAGLGDQFLRHIERTRILLHLIDVGSPLMTMSAVDAYRTVRQELEKYSPLLAAKDEVVVANKIELLGGDMSAVAELSAAIDREVAPISGATGQGLTVMTERIWQALRSMKAASAGAAEASS